MVNMAQNNGVEITTGIAIKCPNEVVRREINIAIVSTVMTVVGSMVDSTRGVATKNVHGKGEAKMIIKIRETNQITGSIIRIISGKDFRTRKTGNRSSGIARS
jgi:hypothetical protein